VEILADRRIVNDVFLFSLTFPGRGTLKSSGIGKKVVKKMLFPRQGVSKLLKWQKIEGGIFREP
jgi:hypothetical protein